MRSVFITCAVTGSGDTVNKSDKVPFTPDQIAADCVAAAQAGAAVVHIHVRDPVTGGPSRDIHCYREVVERIRASGTDVVINLTAGMGGDLTFGSAERPLPLNEAGTDMAGASERLDHVRELRPEICTLDCGTMNFGEGDYVMTNPPSMLMEMARQVQALGVRPELELFDLGHLSFAKWMVDQGVIDDPVVVQLCMGIPWGAPNDMNSLMAFVNNLPDGWVFSTFSIGRDQLRYVAAAALVGGNVRVGLEDNLYVSQGRLATNAGLVTRAVHILEAMNVGILGPGEVRRQLELQRMNPERP
ncbi:MAG: 3-keto-5-aminohexanoate cleavage protein [Acidimicrobiales bacterium]